MTRPVSLPAQCQKCKVDAVCPNCGEKIDRFSPFSNWLRGLQFPLDSSNISNQNLDYIWFCFRPGWLITIEEKMHGGKSPDSQRDVHHIVEQMLTFASGNKFDTWRRGNRKIEYRGHYVIRFSHTNPEDSVWIHINGNLATVEQLKGLLLNGVFPCPLPKP